MERRNPDMPFRRARETHGPDAAEDAAGGAAHPARGAALRVLPASGPTRGIALVLHGGKSASRAPVEAYHLSPARMIPFARHLHRAGRKHGLAVWSLRNSVRGWNGAEMSPVHDALWALDRIGRQHPGLPVFIVGHSMGGLTALCAAGHHQVQAVVALAPWLPPGTTAPVVAGKNILIIHGTADRWTSPAASLRFAQQAASVAASVQYVALQDVGHFMLRKVRLWQTLTTGFVLKAFRESAGMDLALPPGFDRLLPASSARVTL